MNVFATASQPNAGFASCYTSPQSLSPYTKLGIPQKNQYDAPHILRIDPPRGPDRTDKADDFLAKSHSRTQDPGVRFEGWRGLPKMNQASPREAGHKPAF
ncbi:hypothetical protein EMIT0P253_90063 [Pseudomonas sp. IT-P253]|uniref:hypothetical protein n=1 Tax=Pseudomonas sp. IT-P253 TaxID=3026455 RepID=UPI0039E143CB